MTFHCKSKLLFEYPHYYDHNKEVLFSLPSPSLPDHKLLSYSVSLLCRITDRIVTETYPEKIPPNFNTIGLHKSVSTTTSTDTRFSNSTTTNNEHILLVDDEEDIAKLFQKALERAGFIVDTYNDPLQSLSNYRAGMYDLLLLDIKMPEMNGFELYKKIRQIDDKTKVCFMTAFEEYYDEFRKTFPDLKDKECFIRKPIGMNDLIKSVKSHLN